jgi:hypothetical protein
MFTEQLLERGGGTILEGMNALGEAKDVGRHNQEIAKAPWPGFR